MAEDGVLPKFFGIRTGQPPRTSIALQVATAIVLVLIADLRGLLSYLGLTLSLCLALAVSSLFVQHWRSGLRLESQWLSCGIFNFCGVHGVFRGPYCHK